MVQAAFARLVTALQPWLEEIVFVGGWAHRLYREHELALQLEYAPLRTRDADIAIATPRARASGSIGDNLRAAGFEEKLFRDDVPPTARYQLGDEYQGFYAEFLADLGGSRRRRDGSADTTAAIAGVNAQMVRYIRLLLAHPWRVRLSSDNGFPLSGPTDVQIPNPASYMVQKLVISGERRGIEDRAKDALYIHDTIELFSGSLDLLGEIYRSGVCPLLSPRDKKKMENAVRTLFGSASDELRRASLQAEAASGRRLSPETIRAVVNAGLTAMMPGAGL